mmetsp:Transcript_2441/g.4901  ORF Transcript_2441/g.4901 Transcript_2441/m.4901 type:complete len:361 (-) Transcript_2441:297-1379(-)|eukprot:CAMPEP_0114228564 /NCGR_PEP_ID=MMETSP0058-20121206/2416_1 /TAXON_ID=36894 /ORGANISM="Pyramimonas parkeae, CCMP726" /LENGTH=360 /DNA_ID=CAMNT_0001339531 /DNA_START=490 /DNA_END=1572 /DNA_ORIENTATION=-
MTTAFKDNGVLSGRVHPRHSSLTSSRSIAVPSGPSSETSSASDTCEKPRHSSKITQKRTSGDLSKKGNTHARFLEPKPATDSGNVAALKKQLQLGRQFCDREVMDQLIPEERGRSRARSMGKLPPMSSGKTSMVKHGLARQGTGYTDNVWLARLDVGGRRASSSTSTLSDWLGDQGSSIQEPAQSELPRGGAQDQPSLHGDVIDKHNAPNPQSGRTVASEVQSEPARLPHMSTAFDTGNFTANGLPRLRLDLVKNRYTPKVVEAPGKPHGRSSLVGLEMIQKPVPLPFGSHPQQMAGFEISDVHYRLNEHREAKMLLKAYLREASQESQKKPKRSKTKKRHKRTKLPSLTEQESVARAVA